MSDISYKNQLEDVSKKIFVLTISRAFNFAMMITAVMLLIMQEKKWWMFLGAAVVIALGWTVHLKTNESLKENRKALGRIRLHYINGLPEYQRLTVEVEDAEQTLSSIKVWRTFHIVWLFLFVTVIYISSVSALMMGFAFVVAVSTFLRVEKMAQEKSDKLNETISNRRARMKEISRDWH